MGAGLIQEQEKEWYRPPLITTIHNAIKPGKSVSEGGNSAINKDVGGGMDVCSI
jgi:hypothetical protein